MSGEVFIVWRIVLQMLHALVIIFQGGAAMKKTISMSIRVSEDELKNIASMFMDGIDVYAIIDKDNILDEKESPSDNPKKWRHLIKNNIYKISKGGDGDGCDRK